MGQRDSSPDGALLTFVAVPIARFNNNYMKLNEAVTTELLKRLADGT